MAMHTQIETVETGSFTMDYFRFGCGAETLVIVPGLSVQGVMKSAGSVADAYQLLANDFTIYVLDSRKELPASYSVCDMARDTAEALRALGLSQVSVLGASMGDMVSMAMAIEEPHLVRKLVLCSTTACMTKTLRQTIERWVQLAEAGEATDLCRAFGETVYPREAFEHSHDILTEMAKNVTEEDLSRFATLARGMEGFDVTEDLEKISCPVFLVGSKDDLVIGPDGTRQIAERLEKLPGFALHMYDGYGHAAYDTAPDFKERALEFLTSAN